MPLRSQIASVSRRRLRDEECLFFLTSFVASEKVAPCIRFLYISSKSSFTADGARLTACPIIPLRELSSEAPDAIRSDKSARASSYSRPFLSRLSYANQDIPPRTHMTTMLCDVIHPIPMRTPMMMNPSRINTAFDTFKFACANATSRP